MTCQQADQATNNGMFSKNYMPNGCALYNAKLPDEADATTRCGNQDRYSSATAQVVPTDLWWPRNKHNLKKYIHSDPHFG